MNRYHRQILLPEIGEEGQKQLKQAHVLLVGAGGLGCPIALYLTTAGIGHLGIVDDDTVSLSNLGRQVLYDETDIGKFKALCAVEKLKAKNSGIEIQGHPMRLNKDNAESILANYDIVVDGCDNHATRYLISDLCHRLHKPYVYAAIGAFQGQVSVLCSDENTPTYRTLFPDEEATCQQTAGKGVIGTTPAVVGSIAANEVLKKIIGLESPLSGKLWYIDLLTLQTQLIEL